MKVIGIDFTSRPNRRKPLTCLEGALEGRVLHIAPGALERWSTFEQFEGALQKPGPWIAGIDFPFGQSRTFVENAGWPRDWAGYVAYVGTLTRESFRDELQRYCADRPYGDKLHRRATDARTSAISPQK